MFTAERGIEVYGTARGSGWSLQVSALHRYYHITFSELRKMDEIQVQNRMADLKKLLDMERRHIGLAVWGAKEKDDKTGGAGGGRRGRR